MAEKKLSYSDLMQPGGVAKAERDGISKEQIMKQLYRHTDGMPNNDKRQEIVSEFFDRRKS